jgi:S-methylmethionine-dependent homocysteine/selenocysteine methylase
MVSGTLRERPIDTLASKRDTDSQPTEKERRLDMPKYRNQLPQLSDHFFLTDGGIETTLIFHEGLELPDFAAFDLLKDAAGYESLRKYFRTYAAIAKSYQAGFILESATWRASSDWGQKLGYSARELADLNRKAIELLRDIRDEYETADSPMVISGCIGPRGDGYNPTALMSAEEAQQYHTAQIGVFSQSEADMVTAITMNYVEEAIGIARAAKAAGLPSAISFTVETDGKLPTGQTLREAIERVDEATQGAPAYYMINCAHPQHFESVLAAGEAWTERIRGLRANASTKSHAELNDSVELDAGDPVEFGRQHRALLDQLKHLNVFGGCCGTDHRHVEEICKARLVPA